VSSRQLVERSLERISRLDGPLNAVVALRAGPALAEALALDERVAAGEDPGPLAGLPVLVKDLEDVAGMRTTRGSALFAGAPAATRDGLTPARLRAAGDGGDWRQHDGGRPVGRRVLVWAATSGGRDS